MVSLPRQALQHLAIGQHAADHRVSSPSLRVKGLTQVQSTNWSGYADTGSGFSTVTYYYTWWEMYPTNAIQVVGSTLHADDSMTASVVRSGTSHTLKVTDSSRSGDSFSTTQSCSGCANSSAEWIAEAPSGSSGVYPLSNFHSWTESGATVKTTSTSTSGIIWSSTDDEITMIDPSGAIKVQPGVLNGSGSGFSVAWARSS